MRRPAIHAGLVEVFLGLVGAEVRGQEPATPPADRDAATRLFALAPAPLGGPMQTDRPDFTEGTLAVPRGRLQLEGGYTFTYDREGRTRTVDHAFPEFLLRLGLVDDLELRVGWAGWSLTEQLVFERNEAGRRVWRTEHDDAGTDMTVGFKWHLLDQDGPVPDFGVIGQLTLPTGAAGKSSGDVDPEVKLVWAYDLTESLSIAGNVNLAAPTAEAGRFFQASGSVSLGYAVCDWLGAYVEYFGFYPADRGTDAAHTLNGGFTFPIGDQLQFDIRAGFGLNEEAADILAGAGFAVRF